MSIEERVAAVIDRHREAFDRDAYRSECSCGNWTEESFDDAFGHLTHAGHVASVLVAELGLQQQFMQTFDCAHSWWQTPSQWVPNSEMTGIFPGEEP